MKRLHGGLGQFTILGMAMLVVAALFSCAAQAADGHIGVGAKPPEDAEVLFDGSEDMLHAKWEYWEGPRFGSSMPIKWPIVEDPVEEGTVVVSRDAAAEGGKYGAADIVTKEKYRDFRLHVEFLIAHEKGNSGLYLQNRYEIQILDGDDGPHGLAAMINEAVGPYEAYNGVGKWNAYDVKFRAARFDDSKLAEKPLATVYFNGVKAHTNHEIQKVYGGPNSGLDGGNDGGTGITDRPGGIKLQAEGHDVMYRNIWIEEIEIEEPDTDF